MPDYIKRSIELDLWLKAQGIVVEPDEFAPVVWKPPVGEVCIQTFRFCVSGVVCPYYGPGGSDNLLKALRGLELKDPKNRLYASNECQEEGCPCWEDPAYPQSNCSCGRCKKEDIHHKQPCWQFHPNPPLADERSCFPYYWFWGKTDGEALADLLWKLKEESE